MQANYSVKWPTNKTYTCRLTRQITKTENHPCKLNTQSNDWKKMEQARKKKIASKNF